MGYTKQVKNGEFILKRKTTWRVQEISVPKDEYEWATNWRKIAKIWSWHHYNGLHRSEPHPMDKCLKEMMREYNQYHADRYIKCGMKPPNCYLTEGVMSDLQQQEATDGKI